MDRDRARYKGIILFGMIPLSSMATERSLYGAMLTAFALFLMLLIVVFPARFLLGERRLSRFAQIACMAFYFFVYFILIHWLSFSRFFDAGTLYIGELALVVSGQVTILGYLYSTFYAAILCLISSFLTLWRMHHV